MRRWIIVCVPVFAETRNVERYQQALAEWLEGTGASVLGTVSLPA